jgi:hypothetical protein
MSLSPDLFFLYSSLVRPERFARRRSAFEIIVVDRARDEKRFVMTNPVKGHTAACSSRPLTAMAMVFHGWVFVGSLPHRQIATGATE